MSWKKWKHVTKLDPDKNNSEKVINAVVNSGTDAIMIGGTQNVTRENTYELYEKLKDYDIPIVSEPSTIDSPLISADYIFIPVVLNSKYGKYITGLHAEAIEITLELFKAFFDIFKEKIVIEGYIVLNQDSAVAKLTRSYTNISTERIVSYAIIADKFFKLPIVYIEYSGKYGNLDVVKNVKESIDNSRLFYGGGINDREKAMKMLEYADTIVVGNIVYENIDKYLETIP